mmetsp:Transcript_16199/g.33226  ORF Transcript_16199/g.33226 Transcript_16199/m.33226 type:complete len:283 (-) Transcript_16199:39-887(-)
MKKGGPVELGKVCHHDFTWCLQGLRVRFEGNLGRLLDLINVPLGRSAGERTAVADLEGEGSSDLDLVLSLVELGHSLYLAELHSVASLEAVPALVLEDLHNARVGDGDGLDLAHLGVLAVLIRDNKLGTEVTEHLAEHSSNLGVNESAVARPALLIQGGQVRRGERDRDAAAAHTLRGHGVNNLDRNILIQFSKLGNTSLSPRLANVTLLKVKVSAEIERSHGIGVIKSHGLHTSKNHILGHLDAQTRQTDDQDIRNHHLLLGFVTHYVKLTRVQLLVHLLR